MTIRSGRWIPDTCDGSRNQQCYIEHEYDRDVAIGSRVHTPTVVLRRCRAHSQISDLTTLYTTLLDENVRKNHAQQIFIDSATGNGLTVNINEDGQPVFMFDRGFSFSWHYNAQRVLILTLTGFRANFKSALQTNLDNEFGSGKVLVQ